ncbi:hypothetical protein N9N67_04845 [Bacteriovoracaceae bacterium]|nr:hypothetical protein [Bacteriovoracaceae bacterium]
MNLKLSLQSISLKHLFTGTILALFTGRAINYFFFDSPIRVILWNQKLLHKFIEKTFSLTWTEYSTIYANNLAIWGDRLFFTTSIIVIIVIVFNLIRQKEVNKNIYLFAFLITLLFSILHYLDNAKRVGLFLELSNQTMTPLICLLLLNSKRERVTLSIISICIASTFLGHGLFAWGIYPVPAHFIDMTLNTFSILNEFQARLFLKHAAALDLIIALAAIYLIFTKFKYNKYVVLVMWYAVAWGFITSLARYSLYLSKWIDFYGIHSFIPQILFRVPHWTLPLALIITLYTKKVNQSEKVDN